MSDMKSLGEILEKLLSTRHMTVIETLVNDSEKMGGKVKNTIRTMESGMVMIEKTIQMKPEAAESAKHDLDVIAKLRKVLQRTLARYEDEAAELRAILEEERSYFLNEPVERQGL